ncbi:BREX system ATP-binding domain-containing protein [uncultured Parolsenella sp.]|uniref:ATP-binding protein n=1 Tax=uncultured Parolsenella sp. TaxID=2083008 RepID=UPI0027D996B6|nr:BREX system ATP-binding domain-containing protein [uncultured Parolsenella sp.]
MSQPAVTVQGAATPASPRVPKRIAAVIINSLKGGVVPRIGLPYITVGRETEIQALLHDLDLIASGGASFRFLVGRYGAGKSFLLQTIRTHAMGKGFVVADADLSPERRLQGRHGEGLATYRELIRNLSTKTRPEGGALQLVLDRWVQATRSEDNASAQSTLAQQFAPLEEMVHGFDFVRVLKAYREASIAAEPDEGRQAAVLRWLRGEYRTKTEARQELGINACITDDDWYDYLKLLAQFLTGAGYEGLLVLVDELVNLFKIPNAITRQYNYEKILTMYNDTLQGKARHLGIIMGGTPQSIEDRRRGVYSYEALRSRLAEGRFAREGLSDMLAPVIKLNPLTYEELLVLVEKLADIHAGYFGYERTLGTSDLVHFLELEFGRVGADTHLTPREVIRDFVELLDILSQNPGETMDSLLAGDEGVGGGTTSEALNRTGGENGRAPDPKSTASNPSDPAPRDFSGFDI